MEVLPLSVYLLDANVLVALADPAHVQHDTAHAWFGAEGAAGFATCPLTKTGLLRIVGHPRYPSSPGTPAGIAPALTALRALPGYHFWPDDISLMDTRRVDMTRLLTHGQVTDSYLLAPARPHGGQLATLDRRLVADAVHAGAAGLRQI